MKRDKLEKYLRKNVKITLWDNTEIHGVLHSTNEYSGSYPKPNMYHCHNCDIYFRCSHVKSVEVI